MVGGHDADGVKLVQQASKGDRLVVNLSESAPQENVKDATPPLPDPDNFLTEAEFRELERNNIRAALQAANWKVAGEGGAAELLKIKSSTLAYRIKTLGISKG